MRVCLVCPYSWSVPGGVQSHVAGLAAALRGLGAEVEILAPADGPAEGVLPLGRSLPVPSNGSVQRVALSPATVARTARLVRSRGYDVVHVHEPFLPAACLTAVVAARVPVVATAHMYRRALLWYAVFAPLVRLAVRRVDVLLAVSAAAAEYVRRGTGRTAEIVPNGIDYAGLASLDGRDRRGGRILFVGRDEPRKGLSVLLRLPPPAGGDGARARRPQRQLRRARAGARPPGGRRPAARARPRGRPRGAVAGRRELRDRAARGDGRRPARRRERHPRLPPARAGGGRPAGAARRPGRPGRRARRAARRRGAAPQAGRGRAPRGRRLRVAASRAARARRVRAGGCRSADGRSRLRVKGRSARPFTDRASRRRVGLAYAAKTSSSPSASCSRARASLSSWRTRSRVSPSSLPIVSSDAGSESKPKRSSMIRRCRSGRSATARWTRCRRTDSTASSAGSAVDSSANRSPSSESPSEPRPWFRETESTASSASSTCSSFSLVACASSSGVASRPSLAWSSAEARLSLILRSWTCTGIRIVFDWFATAR